jgi:thiol-disulfide isomerase/thioredoxin
MKYYVFLAAFTLYVSAYTLLGFGREPNRIEFLVSEQPNRAKLIIFSADWCGPCKAAKKAMQENVALRRIVDSYEVLEYNFDIAIPMRRKYNVDRVPTFIIVADDEEIKRQVGFNSAEKLKNFLD